MLSNSASSRSIARVPTGLESLHFLAHRLYPGIVEEVTKYFDAFTSGLDGQSFIADYRFGFVDRQMSFLILIPANCLLSIGRTF